jgi:endogenous inhibitor of DNA gyrase (YacG/DUF329 family)
VAQRLRCPTCQRAIQWSEQFPYRPFCSDRCRLIDLGAWLSGKHAIADDAAQAAEERAPGLYEPPER